MQRPEVDGAVAAIERSRRVQGGLGVVLGAKPADLLLTSAPTVIEAEIEP